VMNFNKFLLSHVLCVGVLSMCSFKIYRKSALMPTWLKVMELLNFYDRMMRSWKFRYCYWKSSQSFVFTRGWNKFVKEKYLKANDSISFYLCEFKEVAEDANSFCMIDVIRGENSHSLAHEQANQYVGKQLELTLLEVSHQIDNDIDEKNLQEEELKGPKPTHETEKKGFRLFGVQII
jgi:RAV-like factor